MLKSVIAVAVGVVIASLIIFGFESAGHAFFPTPDLGLNCRDPEAFRVPATAEACLAAVPLQAKLAVVFGWFAGAFGGAAAALLIGGRWAPHGWLIAVVVLLLCVMNFLAVPHPAWMIAGAVFASLLAGFLAIRVTGSTYRPPARRA